MTWKMLGDSGQVLQEVAEVDVPRAVHGVIVRLVEDERHDVRHPGLIVRSVVINVRALAEGLCQHGHVRASLVGVDDLLQGLTRLLPRDDIEVVSLHPVEQVDELRGAVVHGHVDAEHVLTQLKLGAGLEAQVDGPPHELLQRPLPVRLHEDGAPEREGGW